MASADSVHRNIAEGYCRRSIREYLHFFNIALASLGESVSRLHACLKSKQITEEQFERLDKLTYKLENGLLRLVQGLERKRDQGKWIDHLIVKESTTGIPNEQGFDQWLGYLNQHNAHFYYPPFLRRNQEKMILDNQDGERNVYSHDLFTHFALSFIAENKDRPFFLYLPYTIPHAELLVPEEDLAEFRGRYFEKPYNKRNERDYNSQEFPLAAFAAMVTRMDSDVGKIVDLLHNLGIDDDTVIFFSSDNGPHGEGGADPDFFHSSGELRGMKRDLYEGGIRVPLVVKWPGKIEAGRISDHVSAFWDMMVTCAELAGTDVPKDTDGISFVPELLGKGKQEQHGYLYWEFHERGGKQAVRKGKWKAVVLFREKKFELYNLDVDPGETRNVALRFPEVAEEIKQILKEARSESPHWELPEMFY